MTEPESDASGEKTPHTLADALGGATLTKPCDRVLNTAADFRSEVLSTTTVLMALFAEGESAESYEGIAVVLKDVELPALRQAVADAHPRTERDPWHDVPVSANGERLLEEALASQAAGGRAVLSVRDLMVALFFRMPLDAVSAGRLLPPESREEIQRRLKEWLTAWGEQRLLDWIQAGREAPPPDLVPDPPVEETAPLPFFLSDVAVESENDDALDYAPMADAIRDMVLNPETRTPLVMAINAPWGAGKSSLGGLVRRRVEERSAAEQLLAAIKSIFFSGRYEAPPGWPRGRRERFAKSLEAARLASKDFRNGVCWFNAWHHDDASSMLGAFAKAVIRDANAARSVASGVLRPLPWRATLPVVNALRVAFYGFVGWVVTESFEVAYWNHPEVRAALGAGFGGVFATVTAGPEALIHQVIAAKEGIFATLLTSAGINKLKNSLDSLVKFVRDPQGEIDTGNVAQVRERLASLMAQATSGGRRFFIFVDDLERCKPANILAVLELINQLLDHPNVVVIVMADLNMLAAAAGAQYKEQAKLLVPEELEARASMEYGRRFVQKVIQVRFDLPRESGARLQGMIDRRSQVPVRERGFSLARFLDVIATVERLPGFTNRVLTSLYDRLVRKLLLNNPEVRKAEIAREARRSAVDRRSSAAGPDAAIKTLEATFGKLSDAESQEVREEFDRASGAREAAQSGTRYLLGLVALTPREAIRTENALRLELSSLVARTSLDARASHQFAKWLYLRERWPIVAAELVLLFERTKTPFETDRQLVDCLKSMEPRGEPKDAALFDRRWAPLEAFLALDDVPILPALRAFASRAPEADAAPPSSEAEPPEG